MATIYRCDRCNRESLGVQLSKVSVPSVDYSGEPNGYDEVKDLCAACVRAFRDWIKPLPKEGKEK